MGTQTLFLANEGSYGASNGINISYGNLTSAISLKFSSATEVQLIYALSNTYTVGLVSPKIKVVFDVSSALGAGIDSGNNCLMWPEEPKVSITLTE